MEIILKPIGIFKGPQKERYHAPRQGGVIRGATGTIELFSGNNYEQALEGVDGFDQVWVIYHFHRNTNWKPKVMPPRGDRKRGVFSTRSPHRPNHIGMSRVKLVEVEGLKLTIADHDLLDGTPIIDIKPYINYCDAVLSERQGWLDELEDTQSVTIEWSEGARKQADALVKEGVDIAAAIEPRLLQYPLPRKSNRIEKVGENTYIIAYKYWRVRYHLDLQTMKVEIQEILG